MPDISKKVAHVRREVRNGQTRSHHCHATGCTKQVPPAYFMCAMHWRMVPRDLQALVWEHYNAGQENGDADVTQEYIEVTERAINAVAEHEAKRAKP
jgi:hypothetical protein